VKRTAPGSDAGSGGLSSAPAGTPELIEVHALITAETRDLVRRYAADSGRPFAFAAGLLLALGAAEDRRVRELMEGPH
jgi:hypothetical protein